MVKVLIHAGLDKTGSTALQAALSAKRAELAAAGYFYPEILEQSFAGHWALCALWGQELHPLRDAHLIRWIDRAGGLAAVRQTLRAGIARALAQAEESGVVILSDEHLATPTALHHHDRLLDVLGAQAEIRVLAYARPFSSYVPSFVQQKLKSPTEPLDIDANVHAARVMGLKRRYGPGRVSTRIFAPGLLEGGDILSDFAAWVGRASGRALPDLRGLPRVNESFSAAGCAVMARLRAVLRGDDTQALAYANLRRAMIESRPDLPYRALTLPEGWAERLQARHGQAWNAVVAGSEHRGADKARLRVEIGADPAPITPQDLDDWLFDQWDDGFNRALLAWLGAHAQPWAARALGLVRRVIASDGAAMPDRQAFSG